MRSRSHTMVREKLLAESVKEMSNINHIKDVSSHSTKLELIKIDGRIQNLKES